jgi:hypothetical protein
MKTRNNAPTPAADPVMTQFHRYQSALTDTGSSIPQLLQQQRDVRAEAGKAEVEGGDLQPLRERLDTINNALASAGRQRAAATDGLLSMAGDLRAARAAAAAELAGIAQTALADFNVKWNRCCADLGWLIAESAALGKALRVAVPVPAPYLPVLSPDGTRMLVNYAGHLPIDSTTLPPEVAAITSTLDGLDAALALLGGLGQSRELDQRHHALCHQRRAPARMDGVFEVVRDFSYLGTEFRRGMLIDRSVLPDGVLHRCQVARELRALEDSGVAAA